eukprot:m.150660 g.150660  ORF g.150660 m.150660 type:complete len:90 (-) comp11685_c0_seq9:957-1226(-)
MASLSKGNGTAPLTVGLQVRQNGTAGGQWAPLPTFGATQNGVAATVPNDFDVGPFDVRIAVQARRTRSMLNGCGFSLATKQAMPPPAVG